MARGCIVQPDSGLRTGIVPSQRMSEVPYPREIVEAALRHSIRAQQWVLSACAELGYERAHIQQPRAGDELGGPRNPYTVWCAAGPTKLIASYYVQVTDAGVELTVVQGRRPDGRQWTLPEFADAYKRVLERARRDLARSVD